MGFEFRASLLMGGVMGHGWVGHGLYLWFLCLVFPGVLDRKIGI